MIYDYNEMAKEYAIGYKDKSRIYFIEKYLSTFDGSQSKKVQFKTFPRQKVFLRTLAENKNIVSIKPRQCGITTLSAGWICGQCTFADPDAPETVLCVCNNLTLAHQFLDKVRDFLTQVPRWYWGEEYFSPEPKDPKNRKSIFLKNSKSELELFNGCRILARSSGENAARGISAASILIFDEAAFIENGKSVYASAVATTSSNPNAKIIMVSTPNGHDELYYETYRQAIAKENNFIAVQFRWYQDPRYNKGLKWYKFDENGEKIWDYDPIVNKEDESVEYNEERWKRLEQKGWKPTSGWYEEMCLSFNNDSMRIAQELDVSFQGSSDNVVAPEFIEMQEKLNVREPLETLIDPMVKETWFWKPPIDGHRYLLSCLPTGEKVLTQDGEKNVEDVLITDKLVTKDGEYTDIFRKISRQYEGEITGIKLYGDCRMYYFTNNHPIYASCDYKLKREKINGKKRYWVFDFDYKDASTLKKGDWIKMPIIYKTNILSEEDILKKWDKYIRKGKGCKKLPNPLLSVDFWWYCGMWLAEGYVSCFGKYKTVTTCHHIKETKYAERIKNICENVINRSMCTTLKYEDNSMKNQFTSEAIGSFLHDTFGRYAHGKFISEWVKFLPEKYKLALLQGYFEGDGCVTNNNVDIVSVSHRLLSDVQDILLSVGIISSIKQKNKAGKRLFKNRLCNIKDKYELLLGEYDTKKFLDLIGYENDIKLKNRRIISYSFFDSTDKYLYVRISRVEKKHYEGFVHNFETVSESHSFCTNRMATHNCDPSRGSAHDKTGIVVIDIDGRDEDGIPIIEEVAEYNGKKLGDDIGAIAYNYAMMYNEAYAIFDATGGQADAAILTMISLGYKNFYYEDSVQKTYMLRNPSKQYTGDLTDSLPGFHFQGNRYPVLSNFANMVRNNEIKIRSSRIINELNTWIFKENTGKIDHQAGAWDDLICAMAMGLFVMQFSLNKIQAAKQKDKAILNSYLMAGSFNVANNKLKTQTITPGSGLPFYNQRTLQKYGNNSVQGTYLWLFGHTR